MTVALGLGVVAYGGGVIGGDVAMLVFAGAAWGGVLAFATAMGRLAVAQGGWHVAQQWRGAHRLTAAFGGLGLPVAAIVVLADVRPTAWLITVLALAGLALAGIVLLRLEGATRQTRAWLRPATNGTPAPDQ